MQVFGCRKKMSAIAILDYSGAEGLFKEMGQLAAQGRNDWQEHNPDDTAEVRAAAMVHPCVLHWDP